MIETDVIVVGSGPAGSSAAKHAALGGAKVILMDKKSEIGSPKRCAEGVSIEKSLINIWQWMLQEQVLKSKLKL